MSYFVIKMPYYDVRDYYEVRDYYGDAFGIYTKGQDALDRMVHLDETGEDLYSVHRFQKLEIAPEIMDMCRVFSKHGKAIACIKLLRKMGNLGLAEAKRLYDYCVDEEPQALDLTYYVGKSYNG